MRSTPYWFLVCLIAVSQPCWGQAEAPTAQHETLALTFVSEHHPELATLLKQLKGMDEQGYAKAILELSKTHDRLQRLLPRTPDRYETELAIWKLDSRIRLLVARSVKGMEDETRQQIRALLTERAELRLHQLKSDREKQALRLEKMDTNIATLEENQAEFIDRELDRLLKTVNTRTRSSKPAASGKP